MKRLFNYFKRRKKTHTPALIVTIEPRGTVSIYLSDWVILRLNEIQPNLQQQAEAARRVFGELRSCHLAESDKFQINNPKIATGTSNK